MPRLFHQPALLLIAALSAGCGGGGTGTPATAPTPAPTPAPSAGAVVSVRLTPATVQLGVGQTAVLRAEALAADGTVVPVQTFVFSTSNGAVAGVRASGTDGATLEGLSAGSATITAAAEGGRAGAASVVVTTAAAAGRVPVTGRVVDGETGTGVAGASVSYQTDHGQTGTVATAADGSFSFSFTNDSRSDAYVVDATASAPGYVTTRLGGAPVRPAGHAIESIQLVRTRQVDDGAIHGSVLDVRNGQAVAGASVRLEAGQGAATLGPVAAVTGDAQGRYSFSGLAAGTYTVVAHAAGYLLGKRSAITVSGGAVRAQDVGLSPVESGPVVRIVLNWGQTPADLDAHLTGPQAGGAAGRFHVSWQDRLGAETPPYAGLDRDDQDGHGPETITVTRLNGGVYRYSVRDFTNGAAASPQELGRSGASVQVFVAGRTHTFHVPVAPGNLWTVFEMAGDIAEPVITEVGQMRTTSDADAIP